MVERANQLFAPLDRGLQRLARAMGPRAVLAVLLLACVCVWSVGWGQAALEDDKFWWIPKGVMAAERGGGFVFAGALPDGLLPAGTRPPPQWSAVIPDYGHPPLFFLYLGLVYRLFGAGMNVTHLALLPLAMATVLGTAALARRLGAGDTVAAAGLIVCISPLFVAQTARADLDLGLVAVTPWALEAILARRWLRFSMLGAIAVWTKEPGVLLVVPAAAQVLAGGGRRRALAALGALSPLGALAGWAGIHRLITGWGLAEPEWVAPTLGAWALDLWNVARFVLWDQGRSVLLIAFFAATITGWGRGRGPWRVLAAHIGAHVLFFGSVNFLGGDPLRTSGSHWRYLIPCLPAVAVLGSVAVAAATTRAWQRFACWGGIAILSVVDWHGVPRGGVERNLYQLDLAGVQKEASGQLERLVGLSKRVWVGSYAYLDYVSPVVGIPARRVDGLLVYGPDPEPVAPGDFVLESSHGEPLGWISQRFYLKEISRFEKHRAWVSIHLVEGPRE